MFGVSNHHVEGCGSAPVVDGDEVKFSSYFENSYGEQWLVWWASDGVWLAAGDLHWDQRLDLTDPKSLDRVILEESVILWLLGCLFTLKRKEAPVGLEPGSVIELLHDRIRTSYLHR